MATFARRPSKRDLFLVLTEVGTLIAIALLATVSLSSHHAFAAEFDVNKPLTLRGTLVKWEMINPHSWFHINVKDAAGNDVLWMIEGGSPNQLIRLGVTKHTLTAGTELVIETYQAKDGTNKAVGRNFTLPDGRRLFLGGSAPGADPTKQ